jgi:hypothetical protein
MTVGNPTHLTKPGCNLLKRTVQLPCALWRAGARVRDHIASYYLPPARPQQNRSNLQSCFPAALSALARLPGTTVNSADTAYRANPGAYRHTDAFPHWLELPVVFDRPMPASRLRVSAALSKWAAIAARLSYRTPVSRPRSPIGPLRCTNGGWRGTLPSSFTVRPCCLHPSRCGGRATLAIRS